MTALPEPSADQDAVAAHARPSAGELAELIGAFNEVTGRLQATHDQLRGEVARLTRELGEANQQLERSRRLAALGEMAAGIAHEVRNPLGSIRLYARMLEQDLADRAAERDIVRRIDAAAKGLNNVVGDVLAFAREVKICPERLGVKDVLEKALDACRHEGLSRWDDIRVSWAGVPEDAEIEADSGLLHQALVNVLRNAIEAVTEKSGAGRLKLEFRPAALVLGEGRQAPAAAITISDSGAGISDEVLKRMFNPFFTTRRAGTGLGLAIVHRIMDAHGGRVAARNNAEGGATFELIFPVNQPAGGPEPGPLAVRTPDRAKKALEAA